MRKISVVLDEGTTTSQTFGFNVPINNQKKHQNDAFSVSTFSTTSQSVLASRLQPPSKPRQKWKHFNLMIYSIYFLLASFSVNKTLPGYVSNLDSALAFFILSLPILITKLLSQFFSNKILGLLWNRFRIIIYVIYYFLLPLIFDIVGNYFVAFVISFPIFVLVSFIVQLFVPISEEIVDWRKALTIYRDSFYCFRDGICFNEELNENPELFKSKLFE